MIAYAMRIYSMLSLTYTLFFFKKSILNLVSKFPCKWEQCRPLEKISWVIIKPNMWGMLKDSKDVTEMTISLYQVA